MSSSRPRPRYVDELVTLATPFGITTWTSPSSTFRWCSTGCALEKAAPAGITDITILELREWVSMSSRLRQLGAVTLGLISKDTPIARLVESDLVCVPLAEGEIDFLLGVARRSNDGLLGEQIRRMVSRMHPREGGPLDLIG